MKKIVLIFTIAFYHTLAQSECEQLNITRQQPLPILDYSMSSRVITVSYKDDTPTRTGIKKCFLRTMNATQIAEMMAGELLRISSSVKPAVSSIFLRKWCRELNIDKRDLCSPCKEYYAYKTERSAEILREFCKTGPFWPECKCTTQFGSDLLQ